MTTPQDEENDTLLQRHSSLRRAILESIFGDEAAVTDLPLTRLEQQTCREVNRVRGEAAAVSSEAHRASEDAATMAKYLSFLSHDLRGSLNSAVLMIDILKDDLTPEPRFSSSVEDLEAMRRSLLESVDTMDRLLHAERIRQGRVDIARAVFDLFPLLDDVSVYANAQVKADSRAEFELDCPPGFQINSDRQLLAMVLNNLAANAVKYGMPPITLTAKTTDDGCTITVHDHGGGIDPTKLESMFEPFTRGQQAYGKSGNGLGLYIASSAAVLLDGQLTASSSPEGGTKFVLALPSSVCVP